MAKLKILRNKCRLEQSLNLGIQLQVTKKKSRNKRAIPQKHFPVCQKVNLHFG